MIKAGKHDKKAEEIQQKKKSEDTAMFMFSKNTVITAKTMSKPVLNAICILERDRDKVFSDSTCPANEIILKEEVLQEEQFVLKVEDSQVSVTAGDDLGFIYGLLYISEHYLGIKPFWFWMDQKIEKRTSIELKAVRHKSEKAAVRFRGWFYNDEVLMMKWKYNENGVDGWKMALEALLRCGGNMAIPGTDTMSRRNRAMAAEMGLWITHHHAEPLGAEMFVRAYPDTEPNFMEHPELFYKLWEDAVLEQKDCKVVWNLCFRGQGDVPFWHTDTSGQFDTPQKQGRLISELIKKQCDIVKKHVASPVFCTNLYGEIMELYEQGYIDLDEDIIKVRADNGFGRMVTRRRDNHCVRVSSMPDKKDSGAQGIYYHVSFYDLQAANHITMLPNSVDFVDRELTQVIENGGDDFWVINCSNVRPHTYYLDAVRKKWFGRKIDDAVQSREFAADYYAGNKSIAQYYEAYPQAMISYGENEDDHMGEQFYTENLRIIAHQLLVDRSKNAEPLYWIAGEGTLAEQVKRVCELCQNGFNRLEEYYKKCEEISGELAKAEKELFDATLLLQAKIHYYGVKGVVLFGEAYRFFEERDYKKAFVLFGRSAECFDVADKEMRAAEYGVWDNFYLNDCFADLKHTAYMIRKVMGLVRELGDNVRHDSWYHGYCYAKEDQKVFLLLVTDNHMTDQELYEVMREKEMM
ncbi:glycosyl hydrolase 115 family protein [Konateibacter massiliensis]|uniref:glycosyl hydrolase 115 family protein n=1 Tax=Konateibacter massiliensis TaxID=2002841 RepID=UPI000C153CF6|nr:glycosyl hydrolase 115 family protein [Konateibacter massiliensis]